jgi:hypothetical protein
MSENPLVGTWRLVSFAVRDEAGRLEFPFGQNAVGFITYTADGRMAVQFGRAERAPLAVGDWVGATPTDIETAAREYIAYCGTYEYKVARESPPSSGNGREATVLQPASSRLKPNRRKDDVRPWGSAYFGCRGPGINSRTTARRRVGCCSVQRETVLVEARP